MTILILDDEKTIRKAISFALNQNGHQVIEAYNPRRVLKDLSFLQVDLIIMDIDLRVMSGFDFLAALRAHDQHIPVIILTSHGLPQAVLTKYQIDEKHYISKESPLPEIISAIEEILKIEH